MGEGETTGDTGAAFLNKPTVQVRFSVKYLHRTLHRWGWLGFMLLAVSFAALPLLRDGLTQGYDVPFHINRLYQYQEQFFAGQLYPRWLEGSHAGYGSPTFIFYPPMFVWAALPFAAFGFSLSQQLIGSCMLAWVVAATGTYGYMRLWLPHSRIAWFSAVLFVCTSPYFLFNIYFRGAYAEVWAMAWLVWVLWGMLIISKTQQLIYCLPLALATAMVVLSHIPTLLLLGIFGAIAPWIFAEKQIYLTVLRTYIALVIGLLLAAFFLLPAVALQDTVNTEILSGFGLGIASNRWIIIDILKFSPRLNMTDPFDRTLDFPFFAAVLTLIFSAWIGLKQRQIITHLDVLNRQQATLLITAIFISVVMMTDLSRAVYRYIPTLDKIQFSWRWLALANICVPLLWGWLIYILNLGLSGWSVHSRRYMSVVLIGVLALATTGYSLQHDRRNPSFITDMEHVYTAMSEFPYDQLQYPLTDITRFLLEDQAGNYALSDGPEYLPQWVASSPSNIAAAWLLPEAKPLVEVTDSEAEITDVIWQYGLRQFQVVAAEDTELALRMFAWPSWQVRVGESLRRMQRQDLTYEAATGRLTVTVPAGEHRVEVKYVGSLAERWGWFWSGCGLVIVGGIVVWDRRHGRYTKPRVLD